MTVKLETATAVKNLKDFSCDKGKLMITYFVALDLPVVLGSHNLTCLSALPETRSLERGEKEMSQNTLEPL